MNQPSPRPYARRRSGVGSGTTSLLMIFTVLCFATLAMLSLSTAASNDRIQSRGLDGQRRLASARGTAAAEVAGLDEVLLQLQHELPQSGGLAAEEAYYKAAIGAATTRGWVVESEAERHTLVMRGGIDDGSRLVTTLVLLPPGGTARYEITSQVSELVNGWAPEEDGKLWVPQPR